MRALLQRVSEAQVTVEGELVGQTGKGLMILVCAMQGDTEAIGTKLAQKIAKMRIFNDENGKMNLSVKDVGGTALVISQFTLAADLRGNRPGFSTACRPEEGLRLYEHFASALAAEGVANEKGRFGTEMKVSLVNDGPTTIWIDTETM